MYFASTLTADDPALGHLFKNRVNNTMVEARKALQNYNEELFRQYEGAYQVWNNNGLHKEAKALGTEWRSRLENSYTQDGKKTGNVSGDFYFTSKDYFKPMVMVQDKSGKDVIKDNNKLISSGADMIIEYFNNQENGISPSEVMRHIKAQWTPPEGYEEYYTDGRINAAIRNSLISALAAKFQDPDNYKSAAGGVDKIQELFTDQGQRI